MAVEPQALIYVGPKADHEVPKLGTLLKDIPRVVTEFDIAAMGGTTVEDFITFVQGLYNRGGVELIKARKLTTGEKADLKDAPKPAVIAPPPARGETAKD